MAHGRIWEREWSIRTYLAVARERKATRRQSVRARRDCEVVRGVFKKRRKPRILLPIRRQGWRCPKLGHELTPAPRGLQQPLSPNLKLAPRGSSHVRTAVVVPRSGRSSPASRFEAAPHPSWRGVAFVAKGEAQE